MNKPDRRLAGELLQCGRPQAPLLTCIHGGGCNGRYFNLPGFSVAKAAITRGFDVLLVDRPGHGSSPPSSGSSAIDDAVQLLPELIARTMNAQKSRALTVMGHSIGGAVALALASTNRLPISAVTVSGIGRTPSMAALTWLATQGLRDPEPLAEFFFGPNDSYDWRGPLMLRRIAEPWTFRDVQQILLTWPIRFDDIARAITVPVGFFLAQHEHIWCADATALADAGSRFVQAPLVEADLLPDGGHLYEIHRRAPEFLERQLKFLATACEA